MCGVGVQENVVRDDIANPRIFVTKLWQACPKRFPVVNRSSTGPNTSEQRSERVGRRDPCTFCSNFTVKRPAQGCDICDTLTSYKVKDRVTLGHGHFLGHRHALDVALRT